MRRRAFLIAGTWMAATAALVWVRCGPLPHGFLDPESRVSMEIADRNGELLYERLSQRESRSRWLDAGRLPKILVEATVAAEDKRFFSHPGVDALALLRAAWHDVRARRVVEGGSTITQQVVKQLAGRRRRVPGKLREALWALRLEHRLGKREILALYLNLAPYGNQYAGAASAARGYFGCVPENLTAAQAAFLAGLPQRPSWLDPYRHVDRARERQRWVLGRMESGGLLSASDARIARSERLRLAAPARPFSAPHFLERVREALGAARAARRVETTLDLPLQRETQGILSAQRRRLEEHGAYNAAVAVLDNATGEWLAWEGSGDVNDSEHGGAIDGVVAPRQPGSALKPFTYALAFERGFTPASLLPDLPSHFPTSEAGVVYAPRNYDGVFRGPLRARAALAGSENVPAVWLLSKVGVPDVLRLLRRVGLTTLDRSPDYYGYALTMGDAEVRLAELVAAYSTFARGGIALPTRMIRKWTGADGSAYQTPAGRPERILSERTCYWITDILSDPRARAYAFGTGGSLDFSFPVAAKTGTSQGYHDNWTVGFTREVTVGVWVGNFDRSALQNSSGVTGAAPIFHAVFEAAEKRVLGRLPNESDPPLCLPPSGLVSLSICALSGLPAGDACPSLANERLPEGERKPVCDWHHRHGRETVVAWPAEFRAWAREHGLASERFALARERRLAPLRIENPPEDAVYLRDPTLRSAYQTLPLKAVVEGEPRILSWHVDGRLIGTAPSDGALDWPLLQGRHAITVSDENGLTAASSILVK